MTGDYSAQPAGHPAGHGYDGNDWGWAARRHGPPFPVKMLLVLAAFWVFPPLGVAALVFFLWRTAHRAGGCGFRRGSGGWREPGAWSGRPRRPETLNSAFEERRRETLKQLDEEAQAFDDFERRRREAVDKEAFDRFQAERNAPKGPDEAK